MSPELLASRYALVKKPCADFSKGITISQLGKPDYNLTLKQHTNYCETLKKLGQRLITLEPDNKFPDSTFIEDTAVITETCAVITRLGARSRRGEEEQVKKALSEYKPIETIKHPGTVDGGDILRINNHFYIGVSRRTNKDGAEQLKSILKKYGYTTSTIPVKKVLHLKTGITYIGNKTLLSLEEFANMEDFKRFNIIKVDEKESYAANSLLINGRLLMPKGFPRTKEKVRKLGYEIIELDMSEFQKMDGGLTCLSLRL